MKKPHLAFWALSCFLGIIGFVNEVDFTRVLSRNIDIQDNVFMKTNHINLYPLIVICLIVLGTVYWILKKTTIPVVTKLNWIHFILTTVGIIFLTFPRIFTKNTNTIMTNSVYLIFIGQLIFLLNIGLGIAKKIRNTKTDAKLNEE